MPLAQALLADSHSFRRGCERVALAYYQADCVLLKLCGKPPPLPRHFRFQLAHPSNLQWGPLSGSRRYPKVLGYRRVDEDAAALLGKAAFEGLDDNERRVVNFLA